MDQVDSFCPVLSVIVFHIFLLVGDEIHSNEDRSIHGQRLCDGLSAEDLFLDAGSLS